MNILEGKKTIIVGLSAFLIAIGKALSDYATLGTFDPQYVIDSLIALALIFLRQGIKKTQAEG